MKNRALSLLRISIKNQNADFRSDQWECISSLLEGKRLLMVEATGWGKSSVYFIATKLMREQNKGPSLIISPLLSLTRNQIIAAVSFGLEVGEINSSNLSMHKEVLKKLKNNELDVLFITPERLADEEFLETISNLRSNIGLVVVDEAHCISDWGHDFRPDYRRIVRIIENLPRNIAVLATTATANDRVISDIKSQLGNELEIIRGSLRRKSLFLQNITMSNVVQRLAWLAENIPKLKGSGIIYCLTVRDVNNVTTWLKYNNINAEAYHSKVDNREYIECQLLSNKIKVLVATNALGMGYDKPDLGFVIHYQRPQSVVNYYQQVGRAGRAIDHAYGILFNGDEDDDIAEYFINNAFPNENDITCVLDKLSNAEDGLSINELQKKLDFKKIKIESIIKYLSVEKQSPILYFNNKKYYASIYAETYSLNKELVEGITKIREDERAQINLYMHYDGCLMSFLQEALDEKNVCKCNNCQNCAPEKALDIQVKDELVQKALFFLKHVYQKINVKKRWPDKNIAIDKFGAKSINISSELAASEGMSLSIWKDAGWGEMVYKGKYIENHFDDILVNACVEMLRSNNWPNDPKIEFLTYVPSNNHPNLVSDFAKRLAQALKLPLIACVLKVKDNKQQKVMNNSYHKIKNIMDAFAIDCSTKITGACLLVDDIIDSGWTFTIIAAMLRKAGCSAVYPMALANTNNA